MTKAAPSWMVVRVHHGRAAPSLDDIPVFDVRDASRALDASKASVREIIICVD